MDYGYTTSYSGGGGADAGGFMPGSQTESPSAKKQYGKDSLRPVTIKQLIDAVHPSPDAEVFEIDGSEASQVTFVGQIRNISKQTTNLTYRLDDGTGTFEVKVWIDTDTANQDDDVAAQKGLVENAYARVFGKLKTFGKRHVVAHAVRPVVDMNEVNYHLLEATYVHLYFQRGPLGDQKNANQNQDQGYGGVGGGAAASGKLPAGISPLARKVYECIANTPQTNEGLHMQDIAMRTNLDANDVLKAGDELLSISAIYTTMNDETWALL